MGDAHDPILDLASAETKYDLWKLDFQRATMSKFLAGVGLFFCE